MPITRKTKKSKNNTRHIQNQTELEIQKKELTPIEQSLEAKRKNDIKQTLRNNIYMKQQMRSSEGRKKIIEEREELDQMMQNPKMTKEILVLYDNAINYRTEHNLPFKIHYFKNCSKAPISAKSDCSGIAHKIL
jgi:hypothetical protein